MLTLQDLANMNIFEMMRQHALMERQEATSAGVPESNVEEEDDSFPQLRSSWSSPPKTPQQSAHQSTSSSPAPMSSNPFAIRPIAVPRTPVRQELEILKVWIQF